MTLAIAVRHESMIRQPASMSNSRAAASSFPRPAAFASFRRLSGISGFCELDARQRGSAVGSKPQSQLPARRSSRPKA
jgi:hypothetical protein